MSQVMDLAFCREYNIRERLIEWGMAAVMLLLAVMIFIWPRLLAASDFRNLALFMPSSAIGVFFLLCGIARTIALVINGRSSVYGPRIRAWGCLGGALIWSQMLIALVMIMPENDWVPSPGIPLWLVLTFLELISAYLAATDVRRSS